MKDAEVVFKITGQMQNVIKCEEEIHRQILAKTNAPPKRSYTTTNTTYNPQPTDCDCPECKIV